MMAVGNGDRDKCINKSQLSGMLLQALTKTPTVAAKCLNSRIFIAIDKIEIILSVKITRFSYKLSTCQII